MSLLVLDASMATVVDSRTTDQLLNTELLLRLGRPKKGPHVITSTVDIVSLDLDVVSPTMGPCKIH